MIRAYTAFPLPTIRGELHRDEYRFTTDLAMPADAVVGTYGGRRDIETTFGETRSALALGTTRGRCRDAVLRAGPYLFGLYEVIAVLFHARPEANRAGAVSWPGKATVTSSDARCAVRRRLWHEAVLTQAGDGLALQELPNPCANCGSPRSRRLRSQLRIGTSRAHRPSKQ